MPKKARPGSSKRARPGSSKGAKAKAKAAQLEAQRAEQAAVAAAALREAREAVALALENGQAAAAQQDWERAIDAFSAGLSVAGADDEATVAALQQGMENAAEAMATRDEARTLAKRHHADGLAAMGDRDYPTAIAAFRRSLLLDEGEAQQPEERTVIASLRGRLALQSEELSKTLLGSLAAANEALLAQGKAREEAAALAGAAEELLAAADRKQALTTYEQAASLDVNDTALTQDYRVKAAQISEALEADRAAARGKLLEGQGTIAAGDAEGLHWEAAAALFSSGLSVQGIQDEELTAALQEALASTEVGRAARDEARAAAEKHHGDGEGHYASRDYPASISCFEAALSLDTQSDGLRERLAASLALANAGLSAQNDARVEASALAKQAEQSMLTKDHTAAIQAYEAAVKLDVNDPALTECYRALVAETEAALAAAREVARAKLVEGHRALAAVEPEGKHWEAAMDCYASGLSVQGIQDEELTAALQEALASTEAGRAARDEARAAAEKHHGDGEGHYTSRDYPASISCFEAALSLDTQSETLRSKLTQILKIAEAAHEAAELGPTGAPMSLPLLHAHSKIGRWRKGMDAESEDVYATLEEHEHKLFALFQANQADLEALRKRTADGAKLTRPDPWTPPALVVTSAHGEPLDFVPRMQFCGAAEGYVFKRGGQGCGYYRSGSDACAAESLYPLQKRLPFTAPENSHHAVQTLTKRRPDVMVPGGVPKAEHETYVKVLAKELPVLPNGHVLLRGQIVSVSDVRRRRQNGELDAALTEWGWVSMRCPHTKRAWLQELRNSEGDLESELDLQGSAVTPADAKVAVHEAGLREREHRGLAWQWEKSVAHRDRLELPMKEHEKWVGERKEASDRRLAERLVARRRALGLPDRSDSDDEDGASRRHPRWHEWRGRQHITEHKEFHEPWQELAAAGGAIADESGGANAGAGTISSTSAVSSSDNTSRLTGSRRRRSSSVSSAAMVTQDALAAPVAAPSPGSVISSASAAASAAVATLENRRSSSGGGSGGGNDSSYSRDLHFARVETALALAATSRADLDPTAGDEASTLLAHGRLEDSFDLSMSGAGGALALHTQGETSRNSSLNHAALTLQIKLERVDKARADAEPSHTTIATKAAAPAAAAAAAAVVVGNDLSYEEIVAADASILPYEQLRKMDSAKRLENAWSRINAETELIQLGAAQAAAGEASERRRSLVGSRVNGRIAMCRAESRRRAGSVPPLSAAAMQRTGLGAVARYKQLRAEGSFARD
jgi:tetratricopeptide (TPR) repeat protein